MKKKLITIRVDDEMHEALKQEPNYSESIRNFVRDDLMKVSVMCDICDAEGYGTKQMLQQQGWEFTSDARYCRSHRG